MNNNPNQQADPQGQASANPPDHRWNEMVQQNRQLSDMVNQLRGQIDMMSKMNQPNSQQPFQPLFDDETHQNFEKTFDYFVQKKVLPAMRQIEARQGAVADSIDDMQYRQEFGGREDFGKLNDKVQQYVQQARQSGQYIPRSEAFRRVAFDEMGHKPTPKAPEQPAQPQVKFDPYFQRYVDANGNPVAEPEQTGQQQPNPGQQQTQAPQTFAEQNTEVLGYNPYQQPQQQQMQPQQMQQMPGQQQQMPALPSQAPTEGAGGQQFQNKGPMQLDITSSEAELDAFENMLGDEAF
jgi:hypothetical protein